MERKERRKEYLVDITTDDGGMRHIRLLWKWEKGERGTRYGKSRGM